jgi:hypothetical protein
MAMLHFYDQQPGLLKVIDQEELVEYGHLLEILSTFSPIKIPEEVNYKKKARHCLFPLDQWDPITEIIFNAKKTQKD